MWKIILLVIIFASSQFLVFVNACGEFTIYDRNSEGEVLTDYSKEYLPASIASFDCDEFFFLSGSTTAECKASTGWTLDSTDPPKCSRSICSDISAPANGLMSCTLEMKTGSVCEFTCKDGYSLEGHPAIQCSGEKQWTNDVPTCSSVPSDCTEYTTFDVNAPGKVSTEYSNQYKPDSTAIFSCEEFFFISGSTSAKCSSQNWVLNKGSLPKCSRSICSDINAPVNGFISCTLEMKTGSVCEFTCKDGYSLEGHPTIQCSGEKQWTNDVPTCRVNTCPTLSAPSNAAMVCTNGMIANSECSFTCNEGYTLEGASNILCDASNLQWSNDTPVCQLSPCPSIEFLNGTINCTDGVKAMSECMFHCNEGFSLEGTVNQITCISGTWSNKIPTCKDYGTCDVLPELPNGNVECTSGNKLGSVCVLSCSADYILKGEGSIECIDSQWTHNIPNCVMSVECPPLGKILHGSFICSDKYMMSSECTFSCDPNYSLVGESPIECVNASKWNFPQPICEEILRLCNPPLTLLYEDNADCDNTNHLSSTCIVTCDDQQSDVYVCKLDQAEQELAWDQKSKNCESFVGNDSSTPSIVCDKSIVDVLLLLNKPSSLEHTDVLNLFGKILDALHKTIFAGYTWVWVGQTDSNICDNQFQRKPAISEKYDMFRGIVKEIVTIANCWSTNFLSSARDYMSSFGRGLAKPILLFLQTGPAQSSVLKEAEKLLGSGFKIIVVGMEGSDSEDFSGFSHNLFFLGPTTYLKLNELLSEVVLKITDNNCPGSDCSLNGTNIEGGSSICNYVHGKGTVCEFICDEGKVLIGNDVISCLQKNESTAEWDSTMPICKGNVKCPPINATSELTFNCTDSNEPGSQCMFNCPPGLFIKGPAFIACVHENTRAFWNGETPVCVADLLCQPPLMAPSNGNLSCPGGNKFNAECEFVCDKGYNIEGAATLRCDTPLSNGGAHWSKPPPTCKGCSKPPCMQDMMVVLDISAASSEQNFRQQIDWLLKVLASYQGPVEVGDVQVGVMRVLSTAPITCEMGQIEHVSEIIVDLSSSPLAAVLERVGEMEHTGGCPGTLASVEHAVDYLHVVGRSPVKVKRIILLLTNNHDQVALKRSQGYAESEGVEILTAQAGRSEVTGLKVTSGRSLVDLSDDEQSFSIQTVDDVIASKGTSPRAFWFKFWLQAILLTVVTLR